jgi:hypothetical protein
MFCSSLSTKLGSNELQEVGALEEQLGVALLAFNCHALEAAPIANEQVAQIRDLEERLGVALVAVKR